MPISPILLRASRSIQIINDNHSRLLGLLSLRPEQIREAVEVRDRAVEAAVAHVPDADAEPKEEEAEGEEGAEDAGGVVVAFSEGGERGGGREGEGEEGEDGDEGG
jgi:hypothetical protein